MKRTQMIKLMAAELIKYQARNNKQIYNFEEAEKLTSVLLDLAEENGMTPPLPKKYHYRHDMDLALCEWEDLDVY